MADVPDSAVRDALDRVEDPEIPISLRDLGVLRDVAVSDTTVRVLLVPTRLGCPGRDVMEQRLRAALHGVAPQLRLEVVWQPTGWAESDVTRHGRDVLRQGGYVAGGHGPRTCPYCSSPEVGQTADFGGGVCKVPFACRSCGSTFDALRGAPLPVHP